MKRKILLCLMGVLALTGCGKDTIAKKDFETGLKNFLKSDVNENDYEAKLKNGKMIVTYEDNDYTLTYDLKKEPNITYEFEIKKGTSYEEYLSKNDAISLPMLGYFAVLDTYGVAVEDSYAYFIETYLAGMFDAIDVDKESYVIVDDAEEYSGDAKIILTSEFGEKVIDYIKDTYDKDIKIEDEKYDTFDYELTTNCNDKSCVLTAKLTINPEGKFTEISGYADELAKESMDESITAENADYHIELAVGESITISGEDLSGYDKSGMDIVEIDSLDSKYILKATKAGIANGYFYIGEEDFRTYYITVTEDNRNEKRDDLTLTIE